MGNLTGKPETETVTQRQILISSNDAIMSAEEIRAIIRHNKVSYYDLFHTECEEN